MAKVALRFGCAKQSKNLERYLLINGIHYKSEEAGKQAKMQFISVNKNL